MIGTGHAVPARSVESVFALRARMRPRMRLEISIRARDADAVGMQRFEPVAVVEHHRAIEIDPGDIVVVEVVHVTRPVDCVFGVSRKTVTPAFVIGKAVRLHRLTRAEHERGVLERHTVRVKLKDELVLEPSLAAETEGREGRPSLAHRRDVAMQSLRTR